MCQIRPLYKVCHLTHSTCLISHYLRTHFRHVSDHSTSTYSLCLFLPLTLPSRSASLSPWFFSLSRRIATPVLFFSTYLFLFLSIPSSPLSKSRSGSFPSCFHAITPRSYVYQFSFFFPSFNPPSRHLHNQTTHLCTVTAPLIIFLETPPRK